MMGFDVITTTAALFVVWACIGLLFMLVGCYVMGRDWVEDQIEETQKEVMVSRSTVIITAFFVFSFGGGILAIRWTVDQMLWPFKAKGEKDESEPEN